MTKIFFSDLDGTLLNDRKEITPLTRQALTNWQSAGHKLVLCSGRPLPSVLAVKQQLLPDYPGMYLIGFNGGLIYDCDAQQILYRASLPLWQAARILRTAADCGVHCHTYGDNCILTPADNAHLAFYRKTIHMPCYVNTQLADALLDGSLRTLPGIGDTLTQGPCKCLAIDTVRPSRLELLRTRLLALSCGREWNLLYSSKYLLEIFPAHSGKGNAVQKLCRLLGLDTQQAVAAGDQANDISMLETAGTSVAMINGVEDAKKAAGLITASDNNHDGIAAILNTLC